MTSICHNSFALACILASLSLPVICTDELTSDLVTTTANFVVATSADFVTITTTTNFVVTATTADWVTPTTTSHGEVEGSRGSRSPDFEKESAEDMDCTKICSEHRSDESDYGEKERWHKSNRTWNATFEHGAVETEWHRQNGTWNGTFKREGVKGEWESSHNGTLNKSFDRESGEGKWHRNPNGTWTSHYEEADGKRHESTGMHGSNEDRVAHGMREGKAKCDCRQRSGAALNGEQTPQSEVSANSNNDQDNGGKGFGNAAVLGLAGAGIAAICVASSVLLICFRRNGKVPLTSGAVLFGKRVDNEASSDPGVVAGAVVNNV
jgi:hypothetical protein